jgi:mannose-6-phosphate isomerase-like protein (cupin superfamily)
MKSNPVFWVRSATSAAGMVSHGRWRSRMLKSHHLGPMGDLSVALVVLEQGVTTRELHGHSEEEVLLVIAGEVDMVRSSSVDRMPVGGFSFHPPGHRHTVTGVSGEDAHILVLRWAIGDSPTDGSDPPATVVNSASLAPGSRILDKTPLALGGALDAVVADLAPGAEAFSGQCNSDRLAVLIAGEVSGCGIRVVAPSVICIPAGTRCPFVSDSASFCRIVALEFHPPGTLPA